MKPVEGEMRTINGQLYRIQVLEYANGWRVDVYMVTKPDIHTALKTKGGFLTKDDAYMYGVGFAAGQQE